MANFQNDHNISPFFALGGMTLKSNSIMTKTRRQALHTAALGSLATLAAPLQSQTTGYQPGSPKKGWCGGNADYHELFKVSWYYNWQPSAGKSPVEFIPMFKTGGNVSQSAIDRVRKNKHTPALLGFNEPERPKQGNISVEKALQLWPKIEKLAKEKGMLLGSPAPSSDKQGMQWFNRFMKEAKDRGLRIDFVAFHWYRSIDVDKFKDALEELADIHKCNVWLTEFNGGYVNASDSEHGRFLRGALQFLERSKIIDRYAYFNPKTSNPAALFDAMGKLTRLGELYQEV